MMMMTMWGFGTISRKEPMESKFVNTHETPSSPNKKGRRGNGGRKVSTRPSRSTDEVKSDDRSNPCESVTSPVNLNLSDENMSISDTHLGIEVSLESGNGLVGQLSPLSYEDYLESTSKVYRSQFSTNYEAISNNSNRQKGKVRGSLTNHKHRVPLCGEGCMGCDDMTCDDIAFLLQAFVVKDEHTALQEEMKRLDCEIEALEAHRIEMEQDFLGIRIPKKMVADRWDIDLLLKGPLQQSQLTAEEIDELQRKRGRCWTIQIKKQKSRDALCSQLGYVIPPQKSNAKKRKENFLVLTPANCRESHNLRQLVVQSPVTEKITPAIFVTRDTDKAWGHVPARLHKRLKREGMDLHCIDYLSTGPSGAYFCELSSGHTWWGSSDPDFVRLALEWKVARVAFGVSRYYGGQTSHSWIIVGRDGRVAWKNIPARLHSKLELRLPDNPTLAEVTLGSEDSYFVRFLDGSVDYCLPATISSACESIERDGGRITNVILRVDSSRDFVVRHTEVRRMKNMF